MTATQAIGFIIIEKIIKITCFRSIKTSEAVVEDWRIRIHLKTAVILTSSPKISCRSWSCSDPTSLKFRRMVDKHTGGHKRETKKHIFIRSCNSLRSYTFLSPRFCSDRTSVHLYMPPLCHSKTGLLKCNNDTMWTVAARSTGSFWYSITVTVLQLL